MPYPPRRTEVLVRAAREAHRLALRSDNERLIKLTEVLADQLPKVDDIHDAAASMLRYGLDSPTVQKKLAEIAADDYL
jgi:hypothetical protein